MTQNARWPVIMLSGVLVLTIAAGGCTASGRTADRAAGNAVGGAGTKAVASPAPSHRPSQPSSVQLVVEASGDLLIHSAVFIQRLFLSYLPPIWGWITLIQLRKKEYL